MKKKIRKTYGVYGMMEWVAMIPAGGSAVKVHFTGGTLTGYGVKPATFSTDSEVMIYLIENSRYYSSGKIRLVR